MQIEKMVEDVVFYKSKKELALSHIRYEYVRKLTPSAFEKIWRDCIQNNKRFDDVILALALEDAK